MDARVSEVVEGYNELGSYLFKQWSELVAKTASRVEAGGYDVASATEDAIAGAQFLTEAASEVVDEGFRACAILTGKKTGGVRLVDREWTFKTKLRGAKLTLDGPLLKGPGLDYLPALAVRIKPEQLGDDQTDFTLDAHTTGHCGGTYVGCVTAVKGEDQEKVPVWIIVP